MSTNIFDASILLPGLRLVLSESAMETDDVAPTERDSILVHVKQFDGDLSFLSSQKVLMQASYESEENEEKDDEDEENDDEDEPKNWEGKRGADEKD
jgi:hypothetical protein